MIFDQSKIEDKFNAAPPWVKKNAAVAESLEGVFVADELKEILVNQYVKQTDAEIKRYQDEHDKRLELIEKLFVVTCVWLILVLVLVFGYALGNLTFSDSVLITILTTSSAQVLGFFGLVLKYMFNHNKST